MANVKVVWALPTTRESGKPLDPADIAEVEIEMSADLGANFTSIGTFLPNILETVVTELEPGEWRFRGFVWDTQGRNSKYTNASVVIPDNTNPGVLQSLTLSLV